MAMSGSSSTIRIRAMSVPSRQVNNERAALARRALHGNVTAVRVHDMPHHRQADARALDAMRAAAGAAHEFAEDLALFGRRDAQPAITHTDRDVPVVARHRNPHGAALAGILDGVIEQVPQ